MIDGMLESTSDNLQPLKQAQPASLDDRSLERVIRVNTTLRDDLWLYEKQLKIWQTGLMNEQQEIEIRRLQKQLVKLRRVVEEILAMKEKLEKMTIEHLLGKSDLEVGLDFLFGKNQF